jgi:hypothetical protein
MDRQIGILKIDSKAILIFLSMTQEFAKLSELHLYSLDYSHRESSLAI